MEPQTRPGNPGCRHGWSGRLRPERKRRGGKAGRWQRSFRCGSASPGSGRSAKSSRAYLDRGIDGVVLAAVSARDIGRAERAMAGFARPVPVLPLAGLAEADLDIVVECAPASLLRDIAEPALAAGRTLITLSCGALLDNFDLVDLARRHGGRILVPTGALLGLDAVQAAAQGTIARVHMITTKPPEGLDGAPVSGRARHLGHRHLASGNASSAAAPARRRAAFRPMSMSRRRWRWPGSGRTARRSRSGPTPRWTATSTASRSRPTRCASQLRDRERAERRKPQNRPADAAFGRRAAAQARQPAGDRDLSPPLG